MDETSAHQAVPVTTQTHFSPIEEKFVLVLKQCLEITKNSERDRILQSFAENEHVNETIATLSDLHENCLCILAIGTGCINEISNYVTVMEIYLKSFESLWESTNVDLKHLRGFAFCLNFTLNRCIASMKLSK